MPDTRPRLTYLRIRNYRALRDVEFRDLTPLTVLIGANGSGKSTVLDALAFLGECMRGRMQDAWEERGGPALFSANQTQKSLAFDLDFTEGEKRYNYHLELNVTDNTLTRKTEKLTEFLSDSSEKSPLNQRLVFEKGTSEDEPVQLSIFFEERLWLADRLRMQVESFAHPSALKRPWEIVRLLTFCRHINFTDSHFEGSNDAAPHKRLNRTGSNVPNVVFYLQQRFSHRLNTIVQELRARKIPRLESITAEETVAKRLELRLKDAPFAEPIPARFASDGTLRLLAYLVLLNEPEPAGLLGVEEPEAEIHPSLLYRLAEDFIEASTRTQIFVATHSPQFLNALEPEQVWVFDRTPDGYTRATRAADIEGVKAMMDNGAQLGELWLEGYLNPDDRPPETPAAADAR